MLTNAPMYLLGILNSKLIKWYFPKIATDLGENGYRYFKQFVETIPIPIVDKNEYSIYNKLEKLCTEHTIPLEEINALVFRLYKLSDDEITYINEFI